MKGRRTFYVLAFVLQAAFLVLWKVQDWDKNIPLFLSVFLFAFLAYGLAARSALRNDFHSLPHISFLIFLFALTFRIPLLWCEPSVSEDFYRYLWDGRAQIAGLGPYDFPPEAPELEPLRDTDYDRINHKELRTPYPPFAEFVFYVLARISSSHIVFKSAILAFELILIEVLRRLLKQEGKSAAFLLLYAWHPLPVIEFAGSAHMDAIGISLLMTALLLVGAGQKSACGIAFAAAALSKYLPFLALPWLIRKGGWKFAVFLLLTASVLIFSYYTPDMFLGLRTFYQKWRFNDSLFGILYHWFGAAEPARIWGFFFIMLSVVFCLASQYSVYRSLLVIFGTVILFSPVVHPWYLCWIVPFLVFHPSRPWLFFTGWIALSYFIRHLYPTGVWKEVLWLKLLIYLPFFFLLMKTAWERRDATTQQTQ